jgi:hypothetical protein
MSFVKRDGIVINTDDAYYRAVVAQRESEKKSRELNDKVCELQSELSEIRMMLAQITNRN